MIVLASEKNDRATREWSCINTAGIVGFTPTESERPAVRRKTGFSSFTIELQE
jgi:hypothetical protein